MAYIGIDPNVGDITFQKFTGTGSATAFTLSQAVVSGEAIVVTIGNVVQEPGSSASYTAQANTLTFSAAPANGDIITVRYFGRAVDQPTSYAMQLFKYVATAGQTAFTGADANGAILVISGNDVDVYLNGVHLDSSDFTASGGDTITLGTGAALNDELVIRAYRAFSVTDTVSKASGGTFAGGVTMGGTLGVTGAATATGGLNVGTIKEATGTNTAMTIDSDGVVKITQNPCFFITGNNGAYINTTPVVFAITLIDTRSGVDLTNNKYVIPVAGKWQFHVQLGIVGVTGTGACYPIIRKTPVGGGAVTDHGYSYYQPINAVDVTSYSHLEVDAIVDCDVGDSFSVPFVQTTATYYNGPNECRFFGYFLG